MSFSTKPSPKRKRQQDQCVEDVISTQSKAPKVFLPFDIVANILSRLPVTSLARLQCVCSQWRSVISDPYFVVSHQNRAFDWPAFIAGIEDHHVRFYSRNDTDNRIKNSSFDIRASVGFDHHVSNSVNGLTCVYKIYNSSKCYLLNPTTREFIILPSLRNQDSNEFEDFAIAFEDSTREYKIVKLSRQKGRNFTTCFVLTLGTREWRYVGETCYQVFADPVFLHGVLHWRASTIHHNYYTDPIRILTFDTKNEKFGVMSGPITRPIGLFTEVRFLKSREHLCLAIHNTFKDQTDVWIQKDYEKCEWTEEHNIKMDFFPSSVKPPYIVHISEDKLLFYGYDDREDVETIYSYSLQNKVCHIVYNEKKRKQFMDLLVHIESLVSPKMFLL